MAMVTIGDLALSHMMQLQNGTMKTRMAQLTEELSSGKTADIARHLSGSYSFLADIDRNLSLIQGYENVTAEAIVFTQGMQDALEQFQSTATTMGTNSLSASISNTPATVQNASYQAKGNLQFMISTLNGEVAGMSLFSGVDTGSDAVIPADDMLALLRTEIAGETDVAGVEARLDAWFGPGGGFETSGYIGSTTSLRPFQLGRGETINIDFRADAEGIRDMLKYASMAALAADDALGFDQVLQTRLLGRAGEGLTADQGNLNKVRADLGYAQARADEARVRNSSEKTSFEMARTELLEVDIYDVATQLENVQFRLESLYAVTVRMSQLSLVDFL